MSGSGTWIDWQYLFDAAKLLAKCRYTLQYTYPYAYYMELCPRKQLVLYTFFILLNIPWTTYFQFEYQQAQLEAEIENLSWKVEHAETTDRGDLENQMDIAEKRRLCDSLWKCLFNNLIQFQNKFVERFPDHVNFHSDKIVINIFFWKLYDITTFHQ